jgi:2-methylisocitrate lyase-like PEP mutase family enzyme
MATTQRAKARRFHELHRAGRPLVLPNAWDVASALLVERAGAAAVATTSAAVSWSLGAADGERLDRDRALDLVHRVASAVAVPVTADLETGYATTADGVAETVRGALEAGAVGVNLEDGDPAGAALRPVEEQRDRIAAARQAAGAADVPLFVNARVDTYFRDAGDPAGRLAETVRRANAYLAAGADGIFVPGVTDAPTISALVAEVAAPLNVLAGPGTPAIEEFARLGVARVSVGPAVALAAYAVVRAAAAELLTGGTCTVLDGALGFREVNDLLSAIPRSSPGTGVADRSGPSGARSGSAR